MIKILTTIAFISTVVLLLWSFYWIEISENVNWKKYANWGVFIWLSLEIVVLTILGLNIKV